MSQIADHNRSRRIAVDIYNNQSERARLLSRFAISFAATTFLGGIGMVVLNLVGILSNPRVITTISFALAIGLVITGAAIWLLRKQRYRQASAVSERTTVV